MEALALFALASLGLTVTKLASPNHTDDEPPKKAPPAEGFQTMAAYGAPMDPLTMAEKGAAPVGFAPTLDQRYDSILGGGIPPAQPNPGAPAATLLQRQPPAPPMAPAKPQPIDSVTPDVAMNPAGIEANPTYVGGDFMVSELTGQRISSSEFKHNNMTPFFGGSVKQNVGASANSSRLDAYTGSGTTQIAKREVETMFDTARSPFGNPFGMENTTDFVQSRVNAPRNRAGEKPFEPVRVAPALNEGFSATGKGGFQQLEVNQYMRDNLRKTDDLRTADNPKLTYNQPVVPGQHFIGTSAQNPGEVRKYKPDTFYIDENGERMGPAGQGEFTKETSRPIQTMKATARPETSVEYEGPAAAQEFGESYVVGSFRTPMTQQYGGAGPRNADMTSYYTKNVDAPEADYGRGGIEIRPNERYFTGNRTMGLNIAPADTGALTVHYDDPARPTRRAETVGTVRQAGMATGYANGAPAITVWDPNDVARTTVKEGTIRWDRFGVAAPADAPTKLKVYDPDDIARPTQKEQLSAKSDYFGAPNSVNKDFTSHSAAYNMRLNPNKQQIAAGRDPMKGSGGAVAVFDGAINQVSKKIDADYVNDRASAVNRVVGLPTGVGDIGQVRPRVPLKMDVSRVRNMTDVVSAVQSNPLMASQDLARNAAHDEDLLREMLAGM